VHLISKIIAAVKSTLSFSNSFNISAIFIVNQDSIEGWLSARRCQIEMTSEEMRCNASCRCYKLIDIETDVAVANGWEFVISTFGKL
jgi:hypothetical protein